MNIIYIMAFRITFYLKENTTFLYYTAQILIVVMYVYSGKDMKTETEPL
jgi:hypothetical protein